MEHKILIQVKKLYHIMSYIDYCEIHKAFSKLINNIDKDNLQFVFNKVDKLIDNQLSYHKKITSINDKINCQFYVLTRKTIINNCLKFISDLDNDYIYVS
jgi:hypothetical protein